MSRDRFLFGILIGIGVLVVAALILFFTRQGQSTYGQDSTPAGVLHNYILALQKHDYERAYSYLADSADKPDLELFRRPFLTYQSQSIANTVVEVGVTTLDAQGQSATVQVAIMQGNQDLFGTTLRSNESALLIRQGTAWKISSAPYPFAPPMPAVPAPFTPPASLTPTAAATP